MNHHVDTDKELIQRMLIVTDLDPEMVRKLEATFQLTVTGDHNKMFENYQIKYYSRRCLFYHGDDLEFCAIGAAIANDMNIMLQILHKRPKYVTVKESLTVAANRGSFDFLRGVIDIWKVVNNPVLTRLYGQCLTNVIKYGDLDMIKYLAEISDDEGREHALDEAVKTDQVKFVQYLMTLIDPATIDLQGYIRDAISQWAIGAFGVLIRLGGEPDQNSLNKMLNTSAIYNCVEIADFLLTNYNFTFEDGDRALSFATDYDSAAVARLIFERIPGVDPDMCLQASASKGKLNMIKLSIEYGATEFIEAIQAANDEGHVDVYAYFRRTGLVSIDEVLSE